MRIYLNGFMGSGKSTIGKALAKELGYFFVDLDNFIEEKTFTRIPLIFQQWGETYFRTLELEYLEDLLCYERLVIACGGGTITNPNAEAFMNQHGITINLESDFETNFRRLNVETEIDKRPLLLKLSKPNFKKEVYALFDERIHFYKNCSIQINGNQSIPNIVADIQSKILNIKK
jgi:shikimate kinase